MRPKNPCVNDSQSHLFESELADIIDLNHPIPQLANQIPWDHLDEKFGVFYVENTGTTGKPTRLMAGLQYLKYIYNLSDEVLVWRWLENPYWRYFCREKYFQHHFPIHPTSMTK